MGGLPAESWHAARGDRAAELGHPEKVRDALAKLGVDPGGGTPDEFGVTLHSAIARWGKIVKEAGIKIQQ